MENARYDTNIYLEFLMSADYDVSRCLRFVQLSLLHSQPKRSKH